MVLALASISFAASGEGEFAAGAIFSIASLRKGVSGMVLDLSSALSASPLEASSFWSAISPAPFCKAARFFCSSARSALSSGCLFHSSYRLAISRCCSATCASTVATGCVVSSSVFFAAIGCIAEERVKRLLDRAQVYLHFQHYMAHEQPFLRLVRHLVEQRHLRRGAQELAEHAILQARTDELGMLCKLSRKVGETGERVLEQQQGGRNFERNGFAHLVAMSCEPGRDDGNLACERRDVVVACLRGAVFECDRGVAKREQRRWVARCEFVPSILGMGQVLACAFQRRQLRRRGLAALRRGKGLCKTVSLLDLPKMIAPGLGARDVVQHFAHQALGNARRALDHALDLLLDPVAWRL